MPNPAAHHLLTPCPPVLETLWACSQIKASVGATGVVVYIDTRNGICYASRLGASGPFVARSKGAFSNVRVEVVPLASTTSHW